MGQPQDACLIVDNNKNNNKKPSLPSSSSASSNGFPQCVTITNNSLLKAEEIAQHILSKIQPSVHSEHARNTVSTYFNFLLNRHLGIQVHPYGSGPLKTYLPDGDIDLTALSHEDVDHLSKHVLAVLQREQHNPAAGFVVKDIQYIQADVKLIKCLVRSMVVDISFNQHGGLCTLSFLEEIDRIIDRKHLFKRSILLTKAWCYYESRVLGAHHGLISTYALETMIIYIFQVFRTPPRGPLEALYRFLDYFSRFDWDKYCVSLNGPVILSSLPQIVVQKPDIDAAPPLLSEEYLKCYVERISSGAMGPESSPRIFLKKHLNIMDPLKENNNLGRSVSQANYFRIRSAFSHGARTLRRILLLPETSIPREITNFFKNTVDRIGKGHKIHVPIQHFDNTFGAPPFPFGPQRLPFIPCAEAFCGHQVTKMGRTLPPHRMMNSMLEYPTVKTDDSRNREEKMLASGRCNPEPLANHHGNLKQWQQRPHYNYNSDRVMPLRETNLPKERTHQMTRDNLQDDNVFCETKNGSHHEQRPNSYLQRSTDQGAMVSCKNKSRKKPTHQGDGETRSPKESNHVRLQVKMPSVDSTIEMNRASGPSYHLPDVNQFPPLSATRS